MNRLLTYQRSEVMESKKQFFFIIGFIAVMLVSVAAYRLGQMNIQADCERIGAFRLEETGFKCEVMK